MSRRWVAPTLVIAVALATMLVTTSARGERSQSGNLRVSLNGGISPLALPRLGSAPVAAQIEGDIRTTDGSPLPQIRKVSIGLAGAGSIFVDGLPTCPRSRLRNADNRQAMRRCGPALVGTGRLRAQIVIPHQAPFAMGARLLAFNGRSASGGPAIWVHAFASEPPVSFVLPFELHIGDEGSFPTALVAAVPHYLGPMPRLARFKLTFFRRFQYRGKRRSYVNGSCPVPAAFSAGFLAFARATYSFAGNRALQVDSVRSCRAAG